MERKRHSRKRIRRACHKAELFSVDVDGEGLAWNVGTRCGGEINVYLNSTGLFGRSRMNVSTLVNVHWADEDGTVAVEVGDASIRHDLGA